MHRVFVRSLLAAVVLFSFSSASASAADLVVDDDSVECPAAGFSKVQSAIDASDVGDTIVICPGSYVEGTGAPGTNAVTVNKEVNLKGAGADLVTIMPKRSTSDGGQIASVSPVLRDGVGNIIAVTAGTPLFPATVNISGITVKGNGVFAEAGIMFLDAKGSIVRSRVTDIVTTEEANGFDVPGGFRSSDTGFGIVQTTAAATPPAGGSVPRPLLIEATRVDKYNKTGILIDGATNDSPPLTSAGVANSATIVGSTVVGRLRCINYLATGNCATVGTLTTGPLFGQDGLRVTAGAKVNVDSSSFFQNYVNGVGSPVFSSNTNAPISTNNANLSMAAGVRLIGAGASSITGSNVSDNHFGAFNVELDGSTANTAVPFSAENNWWGLRTTGATYNNGPAISPATNPAQYENPVNGAATVDATCVASSIATVPGADTEVPGSDSVDFCPYRNGSQADPSKGEQPIPDSPLPISDAGPSISLSLDKAEYERGDTAVLTADATDDFSVKKVTFYQGANVIDTVTLPAYETEIDIPADAACGTTSVSAVVEDSIGQSDSASTDLNVVEENNCVPPDPTCETDPALCPEPVPPTISIVAPATIGNDGATVSASVTADEGLKSVVFFLGTKQVCSFTAAPFDCEIVPDGADVGSQTIRAVVTDSLDATAETSGSTTVLKFKPKVTFLKIKKPSKKKRVIKAAITLPSRVTAAQGCASGSVTIVIKGGGRPTINRQVSLKPNCSFKTKVNIGKPKKKGKQRQFKVKASFAGNEVLNSATNSRRFK
ncbi:MAG: Ig-like domain-containing protein [Solirubrobacterales bacterium]